MSEQASYSRPMSVRPSEIEPGDLLDTGALSTQWRIVRTVIECEDPDCSADESCEGVVLLEPDGSGYDSVHLEDGVDVLLRVRMEEDWPAVVKKATETSPVATPAGESGAVRSAPEAGAEFRGSAPAARTPDEIEAELSSLPRPRPAPMAANGSPERLAWQAAEQAHRDRLAQLASELYDVVGTDPAYPRWAQRSAYYAMVHYRDSVTEWTDLVDRTQARPEAGTW